MMVLVRVTDAEWVEGCADDEDHAHPTEFEAAVSLPASLARADELVMLGAIHEALITQCDCCLIDCQLDWEVLHGEEAFEVNVHDVRAWGDDPP
jgi:hypothetical protein